MQTQQIFQLPTQNYILVLKFREQGRAALMEWITSCTVVEFWCACPILFIHSIDLTILRQFNRI